MAVPVIGRHTAGTGGGWGAKVRAHFVSRSAPARRTSVSRAAPASSGVNTAALAAIQRAKAYYQSGGGFGKGVEAGLERGRTKAVSAGMQNLVGAGLAGTTMAGGLGMRYEEEVAAPTRAGIESQRAQAISGIEMAGAGMQFQAGQAGAQRSLQQYIAELQANLQRESMAFQSRPTERPIQQAQQFPSLYDQETQGTPTPNWMGSDTGGVDKYAGMTGNLISDAEWADIQSQANRLR